MSSSLDRYIQPLSEHYNIPQSVVKNYIEQAAEKEEKTTFLVAFRLKELMDGKEASPLDAYRVSKNPPPVAQKADRVASSNTYDVKEGSLLDTTANRIAGKNHVSKDWVMGYIFQEAKSKKQSPQTIASALAFDGIPKKDLPKGLVYREEKASRALEEGEELISFIDADTDVESQSTLPLTSLTDPQALRKIDELLDQPEISTEDKLAIRKFFEEKTYAFQMFMGQGGGNIRFDKFLRIVDYSWIKDKKRYPARDKILDFAISDRRWNSLFFKESDLDHKQLKMITSKEATLKSKNQLDTLQNFKVRNPTKHQEWINIRKGNSTTLTMERDNSYRAAKEGWEKAESMVTDLAKSNKPMTASAILNIHKVLGHGQGDIPSAGCYRKGSASVGHDMNTTPAAHQLESRMKEYEGWLEEEIQKSLKGDKSAIVTAAQAYQRLVSIHPFENGNGRISRFVMDYVLLRCGLPPAAIEGEVNDGVFGLKTHAENDGTAVVEKVYTGVLKSAQMIH